ncbi:MAG: hypothetical protein NWF03_02645 [Candidatus Bathyarchaeota archaeon]|nr:hypothetical protein [Candidatus Bathyarchaeota archaeon]
MPFIVFTINANRVNPMPVEALVDTGSPWLAITPKDSLRLNISIKHLKKAKNFPTITLASHKFHRYILNGGTVCLKDEKGKLFSYKLPISVLWPTKKKWPSQIKDIPSVVGSDFLTFGKLHFYFDPYNQIAFLEKT